MDGNFTSSLGATVLVQWVGLGINLVWRAVEGMPSQHWYWVAFTTTITRSTVCGTSPCAIEYLEQRIRTQR